MKKLYKLFLTSAVVFGVSAPAMAAIYDSNDTDAGTAASVLNGKVCNTNKTLSATWQASGWSLKTYCPDSTAMSDIVSFRINDGGTTVSALSAAGKSEVCGTVDCDDLTSVFMNYTAQDNKMGSGDQPVEISGTNGLSPCNLDDCSVNYDNWLCAIYGENNNYLDYITISKDFGSSIYGVTDAGNLTNAQGVLSDSGSYALMTSRLPSGENWDLYSLACVPEEYIFNQISVQFLVDGVPCDANNDAYCEQNLYYGDTIQLPITVPAKPGWRFVGWDDGSGNN